ncbi:MAG: hypothetical protein IJ105_04195 [Bacilli bacterium]|nr:hypothetical protein [Bacilli bacterium]
MIIEYKVLPPNEIFKDIQIRKNKKEAYENAILRGMRHPDNWIYMYSKDNKDYFKNSFSRKYISYPQFGFYKKTYKGRSR